MYADHMPPIRDAMRADYQVFQRGILFVVCSIRQSIIVVPDQLNDLWNEQGENPLFGHKLDAWAWINDKRLCRPLWETMRGEYDPERMVLAFSQIPGLGIVKSAFVAQLMGSDIACLDSRDETRAPIAPMVWHANKLAPIGGKSRAMSRTLAAKHANIGTLGALTLLLATKRPRMKFPPCIWQLCRITLFRSRKGKHHETL